MTKVVLYPLPHKCKGVFHETEERSQIVVLNSRLTREAIIITYKHKISNDDNFEKSWMLMSCRKLGMNKRGVVSDGYF